MTMCRARGRSVVRERGGRSRPKGLVESEAKSGEGGIERRHIILLPPSHPANTQPPRAWLAWPAFLPPPARHIPPPKSTQQPSLPPSFPLTQYGGNVTPPSFVVITPSHPIPSHPRPIHPFSIFLPSTPSSIHLYPLSQIHQTPHARASCTAPIHADTATKPPPVLNSTSCLDVD